MLVATDNEAASAFCFDDLRSGQLDLFGGGMYASHATLRLFGVVCIASGGRDSLAGSATTPHAFPDRTHPEG